ncbi:MAG: TIGR03619 family F420-dependent LLM class oxidoreductase [Acidimicrobiia bacterium]
MSGRDRVKVSVTVSGLRRLFGNDLATVVDMARVADDAGIDQIVMPDHLAMGPRTDRYPFGEFPYPPDEPWLEPLTVLGAMASATRRIRLATGVLIGPLRPALVVARTVATIDVLSHGRVDLGIGTGWQREEYTERGLPFRGRAARMDDMVRACRAMWEQEPPVSFSSDSAEFSDLWCEPRPVQERVPVWYAGGPTDATARRIVELGDGWLPLGVRDEEIGRFVHRLRAGYEQRGRDPATLGVRTTIRVVTDDAGKADIRATLAPIHHLAALGVTGVSVALGRFIRTRADIGSFLRDLAMARA